MFTVEQRDRVRDRVLAMARADERVVSGAVVGGLAMGGGDRWSDLDLTFGLAEGVPLADVLEDWSAEVVRDFGAVHLFDLPFRSSTYRVFLLPGCLQVDMSFTPSAEFGPTGPRFKLLFGQATERPQVLPAPARQRLGLAAHHAVRARFCIERGRLWQAQYWIGELRDEALALACQRRGFDPSLGRGYDQLPNEVLSEFEDTLVGQIERAELLRALRSAIGGLLRESAEAPDLAAESGPACASCPPPERLS
ncbi:MAG: hypothetical protein J2P45_00915 [Candidatus Dormibacteraeota bacterium]|nr:hypothetical protein [Candidatus Dormibacteraeota bacterium]